MPLAPPCPGRARFMRGVESLALGVPPSTRRFNVAFQRFLIALSVRPGSKVAISAHLLPWLLCASTRTSSSLRVQPHFLMSGFRWLCHRSRHCFPMRPGSWEAM